MRLVTYDGGTGRLEEHDHGTVVVPLEGDLVDHLTGSHSDPAGPPLRYDEVRLRAPLTRPGKIICVGLNYRDHAAETGKPIPEEPVLFAKFANSVVGDGAVVTIPAATDEADWEAELGVIIGSRASQVSPESALDHVGGYTCLNDLSARDLQRRGGQWTRGKAIDGFLPMGPVVVTADEVGDPQQLQISCRLNGTTVQSSRTSQMVFGVAELVSTISQTMTLEPGDCIATGTPPGVGMAMSPPRFLRPGDVLQVEIERIGTLTTQLA